MIRWLLIYGVPALLMLVVWAVYTVHRARSKGIASPVASWISLLAMVSATVPAFSGLWALRHVDWMVSRVPTDYRFEDMCVIFGVLGVVAATVWVSRSRQFCSFATLAASAWMSFIWGRILLHLIQNQA